MQKILPSKAYNHHGAYRQQPAPPEAAVAAAAIAAHYEPQGAGRTLVSRLWWKGYETSQGAKFRNGSNGTCPGAQDPDLFLKFGFPENSCTKRIECTRPAFAAQRRGSF